MTFQRAAPLALDMDRAALQAHAADDHGNTGTVPLGIARPADTDQVAAVLKWANEQKIAVVPVSSPTGPRRRGDTVSATPAIVMDMSRNRRVIHVDGENRIAIVEPGVTFGDFDAALRPHGLRSFKPLLPRRTKSVLACHLEREPITSCYEQWDTADPLSAIELVFGNGERFRTGGAAAPGSLQENLKRGLRQMVSGGPMATDFTRVFQGAQGSLGVVCWGSVYCEPLPPLERAFLAASEELDPLVDLAYRCCWRRLSGQLFIVNRDQLALMLSSDPASFERARAGLPKWVLFTNLTAAPNFPEEHLAYVQADFFADAAKAGVAPVEQLNGVRADALGRMLQTPVEGDYKIRASGAYSDFFFLTQLDKAGSFANPVDAIVGAASDVKAGVYIQPMVHGVSCHVEATLLHTAGQRTNAAQLRQQAVDACRAEGAFYSRPYAPWGEAAFRADPAARENLAAIKRLLDPNGIMNPDRFR